MAAARAGHRGAPLERGYHAVEGGQPLGHQMGVAAGPEEPLAALVHVGHVIVLPMPAPVLAASVIRAIQHRAKGDLEQAGQVGRAGLVGQGHRLLGGKRQGALSGS